MENEGMGDICASLIKWVSIKKVVHITSGTSSLVQSKSLQTIKSFSIQSLFCSVIPT